MAEPAPFCVKSYQRTRGPPKGMGGGGRRVPRGNWA